MVKEENKYSVLPVWKGWKTTRQISDELGIDTPTISARLRTAREFERPFFRTRKAYAMKPEYKHVEYMGVV